MKFRTQKIGWRSLIMASVFPLTILAAATLRVPAQTGVVSRAMPGQQDEDLIRTAHIDGSLKLKHRQIFRFQDRFGVTRGPWIPNAQFMAPASISSSRTLAGTRTLEPAAFDPFNSSAGYISQNDPWSTADSALFPNGITTAG